MSLRSFQALGMAQQRCLSRIVPSRTWLLFRVCISCMHCSFAAGSDAFAPYARDPSNPATLCPPSALPAFSSSSSSSFSFSSSSTSPSSSSSPSSSCSSPPPPLMPLPLVLAQPLLWFSVPVLHIGLTRAPFPTKIYVRFLLIFSCECKHDVFCNYPDSIQLSWPRLLVFHS